MEASFPPPIPPLPPGPLSPSVSITPCEWSSNTDGTKMPILAGVYCTFASSMIADVEKNGILIPATRLQLRIQTEAPGNLFINVAIRIIACNGTKCDISLMVAGLQMTIKEDTLTVDAPIGIMPFPIEGVPGVILEGLNTVWIRWEAWDTNTLRAWSSVRHDITRMRRNQ